MNSSKRDSGWILCPSKSFPGKFYYFNVRNGEAVWGSNEIDNKTARKDTTHTIADKSHCYPEPSSPPLDEYPNISNINSSKPIFAPQNSFNISVPNEMTTYSTNIGSNIPTIPTPFQKSFINVRRTILNQQRPYNTENLYQNFVQQSPQFSQTIYPKYVSNVDPYMQNVIWTPIQMPRPMILANPIKTELFDENMQTWEDRCNITVQSCNIPLTKRFVNYEDLHKNNGQTELTSTQMFVPTDANIRNSNEKNIQMFEQVNKSSFEPIKRLRTQSESDRSFISNNFLEKPKDTSFQIKALSPTLKVPFTRLTAPSDSERSVISNDFVEKSKDTSYQIKSLSPTHKVPFRRPITLFNSDRSVISNDFVENTNDSSLQIRALSPTFKVPFTRPKKLPNSDRRNSNDFEEQCKDTNFQMFESDRSVISNDFEENSKDGLQNTALSSKHKIPITRPLFERNKSLETVNDQPTVIKYHGGIERDESGPKPTLLSSDKVENKDYGLLENLEENDLRFMLMAKKRRTDFGGLCDVEGKRSKTIGTLDKGVGAQKKRVTFQISESSDSSEEIRHESIDNDSQEVEENLSMNQFETKHSGQYWYIIPDTGAILEDFQEMEQLVQSDNNFRLMLPYAVRAEIVDISAGDFRGQRLVVARQLLRRLATLPRHILSQNPEHDDYFNKCTMDRILHCCLQLKDKNPVILITDDVELRKTAKLNDIHAYTLKDIKDGVVTDIIKREHEKYMKIKITVKNDTNSNLFLQNMDEFNPFPLNKDAIFVNIYRLPLFKDKKVTDKHIDMKKSITSLIKIKKIINEDKSHKTNNISFDIDSETSDIGDNMQKLVIRDKYVAEIQTNKITFGKERTLINRNNIELQSNNKNRDILSKPIETERSYQKCTKENESKYEDNITPNQKTNNRKEINEERFHSKNVLINRNTKSKIDKFYAKFNEETNNTNSNKDTDINKNDERLQCKMSLINTVKRSEIGQLDNNVQKVVNTKKSPNIPVQKDVRHIIDYSDVMDIEKIHTNVDEELKLLKNRLTKMVVKPKIGRQDVTNSLDQKLKKFQVRNELMAEAIKFKMGELVCTYTQVMEEALSCLLQNSNSKPISLTPPWTLHEALTCVKKIYDNAEVRMYADELTLLILNNCCKQGKLQPSVKPNDFMRILGLGSLLIDFLKSLQPDCEDLAEAQQLLSVMCENISSTDVDDIEPTLPPTRTDDDEPARRKYLKTPADVVEWLKNHFPQWEAYEEPATIDNSKQITQQNDMKIVRTSGRNINLLTINNKKSLILNQPVDYKTVNHNTETDESAGKKTMKTIEQREHNNRLINKEDNIKARPENPELSNKNAEPKIIRTFETSTPIAGKLKENYIHIPTHGNTFNDDTNDGPKVVRNLKLIDAFEEKLKAKSEDYTKIDDAFSTFAFDISPHTTNDDVTNNDSQDMSIDFINNNTFNEYSSINNQYAENDIFTQNNDKFTQNNDIFKQNNDTFAQNNDKLKYNDKVNNEFVQINDENDNCVNNEIGGKNVESISIDDYDSGFENDNTQMYTVLRMFLTKLSISLKMIYKFIDESILVFRDEKIEGNKLKSLQDKATQTHEHLASIIYKLKSIIHRESGESTVLKEMLITSGITTTADKRMTRYKQVVTKCLEQAQMLENALKIMLTIADGDLDTPLYIHVPCPVYFNIFE